MICRNCGAINDDNVRYCANCGADLTQQNNVPFNSQPNYGPQNGYNTGFTPQQSFNAQPMYNTIPSNVVPGKGLGIASMILGIVGLVLFCFWYISIPCAIVGIILGIVGNSKAKQAGKNNGMATAGIICSAISIALAIIFIVVTVVIIGEAASVASSIYDDYHYYY